MSERLGASSSFAERSPNSRSEKSALGVAAQWARWTMQSPRAGWALVTLACLLLIALVAQPPMGSGHVQLATRRNRDALRAAAPTAWPRLRSRPPPAAAATAPQHTQADAVLAGPDAVTAAPAAAAAAQPTQPPEAKSAPAPAPAPVTRPAKLHAYILSNNRARYDFAVGNMERHFPGLFQYEMWAPTPLSDPRITARVPADTSNKEELKLARLLSNRYSFVDMWHDIAHNPRHAHYDPQTWFGVFEDDVAVVQLEGAKPDQNYTEQLTAIFEERTAREHDGVAFGGLCDPHFLDESVSGAPWFRSHRGTGFCLHASFVTRWRAANWWQDIQRVMVPPHDVMDQCVAFWGRTVGIHGYTLGSTVTVPGHWDWKGLIYQDRITHPSTIW